MVTSDQGEAFTQVSRANDLAKIGFSRPFLKEGTPYNYDIIANSPYQLSLSHYVAGKYGTAESDVVVHKVEGTENPYFYEMVVLGPRNWDIANCYECAAYSNGNYMCQDSLNTMSNLYDTVCCP